MKKTITRFAHAARRVALQIIAHARFPFAGLLVWACDKLEHDEHGN